MDYKNITTLLDNAPKEQNARKRAKWVANVLNSVDLDDESVVATLLQRIEKSKLDHPIWNGSRLFSNCCLRNVRETCKYLIKKDKKLGLEELHEKKYFLEVSTLLALWSSMDGMSTLFEWLGKKRPKSMGLAFKKRT